LALRVERHVENAKQVAQFLQKDHRVDWVNYIGFPQNPYYAAAQRYLGGKCPSLMTFGVKGGFEAGKRFLDALKMFKRLVNMGDAKSLATHPASTTQQLLNAGIKPETIRLSIGIEHIDDIVDDLDQALKVAYSITSA
jgi:O-acetylhomoserine (thiol)-lyase